MNHKIKIRGIYSTALTYILLHHKELLKRHQIVNEPLLDQDFDIVQPSIAMEERFGLKRRDEPPDLNVYDRPDRQGVLALGKADSLNAFVSILKSLLDDVVARRWKAALNGIYKGLVKRVDPTTHSVLIDIGSTTGRLDDKEISSPELGQIVVQVERRRIRAKEPILTTKIKIPGKYAVLIPGHQIRISRKILNRQTRSRLHKLGEELAPPNWGILWRTAVTNQPPEVLRNEVISLAKEGQALMEKAEGVEAPATLREGSHFVDVEFPALSKKSLDEFRRFVAPTIDKHHYYKARGGKVSAALEMAEKLLEKGSPYTEVENLFEQTIEAEYPIEGSVVKIEHVKLDGKLFHLGVAQLENFDADSSLIRFSRVFEKEGTYDGLGIRKEPGDLAVTEAKVGEWHLKTRYFSKSGQYKGTYINLNTPIELYPYGIRYVDLEVDICVWPDSKVKKLDEEKLERAAAEGLVTEKLVKILREKVQELMEGVSRK